jgi:hypothetical protein
MIASYSLAGLLFFAGAAICCAAAQCNIKYFPSSPLAGISSLLDKISSHPSLSEDIKLFTTHAKAIFDVIVKNLPEHLGDFWQANYSNDTRDNLIRLIIITFKLIENPQVIHHLGLAQQPRISNFAVVGNLLSNCYSSLSNLAPAPDSAPTVSTERTPLLQQPERMSQAPG